MNRSLLFLSALLATSCGGSTDAGGQDGSTPQAFALTVTGGFGSGAYAAGATVHVFADLDPASEVLLRWEGDTATLASSAEWHSTVVMPARDVDLVAVKRERPVVLTESTFAGATATAKRVRSFIPPNPRGLILFLHGTGGSANGILRTEQQAFVLAAAERGYAILATEAEEVQAGDLNNDGKVRWNASLSPGNTDFANLDALIADLRQRPEIGTELPIFVMGMSNGGSMTLSLGTVAAVPELATAFGHLRFSAAASYCASGRTGAASRTTTPTAWYLCRNDTNPNVGSQGNSDAEAHSAALVARGVETGVRYHEASPLYDERFTRAGLDANTSTAIVAELEAAGFVGANRFLTAPPSDVTAAYVANPAAFPRIGALSGAERLRVSTQIAVVYADHSFFSDLSQRTLDWFDVHNR